MGEQSLAELATELATHVRENFPLEGHEGSAQPGPLAVGMLLDKLRNLRERLRQRKADIEAGRISGERAEAVEEIEKATDYLVRHYKCERLIDHGQTVSVGTFASLDPSLLDTLESSAARLQAAG